MEQKFNSVITPENMHKSNYAVSIPAIRKLFSEFVDYEYDGKPSYKDWVKKWKEATVFLEDLIRQIKKNRKSTFLIEQFDISDSEARIAVIYRQSECAVLANLATKMYKKRVECKALRYQQIQAELASVSEDAAA